MSELQGRVNSADFIPKIDLKCGFGLLRMALGLEKFIAFRTKFGLYKYMVMPFGLPNASATFQMEMNRILRSVLGIELVINTKVHIDEDNGLVVVVYIEDILIATRGSLGKKLEQVRRVFDLLLDNDMSVEINQ